MTPLRKTFFAVLILVASLSSVYGEEEVIVRTPSGQTVTVDINADETFLEVFKKIDQQISAIEGETIFSDDQDESSSKRSFLLDFMFGAPASYRANNIVRDYSQSVSAGEKSDIRYIVTTLASSSWTSLMRSKSSLKKAGDRVDHLHPFRFLMCIFSDEEMKAGVHSIRERKKIWGSFSEGLYDSLEFESKRDNLKLSYIQDFAKILNIDPSTLFAPIKERRWDDLIDALIKLLPRGGDPGRYDM